MVWNRAWVVLPLLARLLAAAPSVEERRDLVYLGRPGWVSRDRARDLGFFEYRGRWLPKKLERRLLSWERKDARVRSWDDAYKVRSRHYRIETNLPHYLVELEIRPFLDALYKTYGDVFKRDFGLSGRGANKKTIRIFHGYRDYALKARDGSPIVSRKNPGFIRNGSELVVFYEETDPATFYGTVFHEGAHQFFHNLMPAARMPLWLSEALAVYFEGCVYSRSEGRIRVGHLPPDRLADAKKVLADLASPQPDRLFMDRDTSEFGAREYALAWSFVYYLTHSDGGKRKKKFARFLRAMNGSGAKPVAEVFRKSTGLDLEELGTGWRDFILALECDPSPRWVELEVEGDASGLRSGDRVWSLDGVRVHATTEFKGLWRNTGRERPIEWVVVRRDEGPLPNSPLESFVRVTVAPDCEDSIRADGSWRGSHNLAD